MTHYLIDTDNLKKLDEYDFEGETPPVLADAKKQKWVEIEQNAVPEYDSETHHLEISQEITLDRVVRAYKAISISADELAHNILQKRQQEYGDIGEQLGMIYDDKINGTNLWQAHITKVKADNPKINNSENN